MNAGGRATTPPDTNVEGDARPAGPSAAGPSAAGSSATLGGDHSAPTGGRPRGWLRSLLPFLFKHTPGLAITFGAALAGMAAQAVAPLLMKVIVDDAIINQRRPIGPLLLALLAVGGFRFGIGFVRRYFGARVAAAVDYDLRNAIYDHLHRLDFTKHDEMQTGQLVSRANTDVQVLQRLLSFLPIMSSNILLFPVSLGFMISLSLPLSGVAFVIVPVFLWMTLHLRKVVYPSSWDASQRAAEVAGVVDEAVSGVRIVKAFGQEQRELDRLTEAAGALFGARMRNIRLSAKRQATMMTVPMLGQVATLGLGGLIAINGGLTVGSFLAFLTYLAQLVAPIGMMAGMLVMAQMARASAERVLEILDSTPEVTESDDAGTLGAVRGELRFDGVRFGYVRSQPVLDSFDLVVEPGETVALVGASGSGKSTVGLLLPRFYDPQAGTVSIDGTDIRRFTLDSLRANIGVVFEDSFLFSDTIRANIAYGQPDANDADVEAAARAAEAHEFISRLPDGYQTVVGERGLSLSGGQRQRIALARAIITDPRILVLDDATSSIDVKVEEDIHRTLRRLMDGRTTVVIAHRRSSLELADRIVVVGGGRVVDEGTHDELMARCHLYRLLLSGPDDDIDTISTDVPDAAEQPTALTPAVASPAAPLRTVSTATTGIRSTATGPAGARPLGARPLGMPPEELEAKIAALPPVRDVPDVDTSREMRDTSGLELRRFVRPFRRPLIVGVGLVAVDAASRLAGPYLIRWGIDHGVIAHDRSALATAVGLFVAVALAGRTTNWFATVYTGRTGQRMLYALRIRVFAQLQRLGLDYYDREMAGRVMTRMTSDIEAMNQLLQSGLIQSMVQVVTFGGTIAVMFSMNVKLTLWVLLVAPPLAAATLLYRSKSSVAYTRVRDGVAAVNANFQESISGMRVAQAFGRERRNMADYRQVTGEYLDARLDSQRISSVYFPFVELMSVVASVVVLGAGARYIRAGTLTDGELIAFSLYIATVFAPLQQLSSLFDTYQQATAALAKLRELLSLRSSIPEADEPVVPDRVAGAITFDGVHFSYSPSAPEVLAGIDLHIPAGQTVALVGETGAGKSTIVKLIARFYDPTAGAVLIDGVPLTELSIGRYRQQLGYVPQEPFLFSGTIRDNIAYGKPDASDVEVRAAAMAVGADAFVDQLDGGYDHPVSERGRSLSAGQRQLIALARALLVDPAILLLDEATANLDLATEAKVNRAMGVVSEGRTTIVVAHRIPTAHRSDRILVIDGGRVVEDGAPAQLLERDGRYADLWRTYTADPATAQPV